MNPRPCDLCGLPFTDEEWDNRHDAGFDQVVHAWCCDECESRRAAQQDRTIVPVFWKNARAV